MATLGVLALQGGYAAHARLLKQLGHEVREVRTADDLQGVSGLVLPGGESTAQLRLMDRFDLFEPIDAFGRSGKPVLATCAGMILASTDVIDRDQKSFGWVDISVRRNGWGRQQESFEACADGSDQPLLFIRAPRIERLGTEVEVLMRFRDEPVAVRQGAVTAAAFHPELTGDTRLHEAVFGRVN